MSRPGSVLVLYHRPSHWWFKDAATVREHIHAIARYSRFCVWEVNTDHGFPAGLERVEPGAIVLHYSLFGSGLYKLDERFLSWLDQQRDALKVAFFQDEHHFCQKRFRFVNDFGVDVVFTHVDRQHFPEVWGRYAPETRAVFNLPGYVDERLLAAARRFALPDARRDVDVGYRGRALPPYMGAGSQEKRIIGERFRELAARAPLHVDIETSEQSRLYGSDWYEFLGRCRATLGVEAGASFMDLEDECHAEFEQLQRQGRDPTLDELNAGALGRWDGNLPYRTIGPRHFEAAAFRVCQVLFEGSYSGAMQPFVHYLPLARDFRNIDDILAGLMDPDIRARITDRAYQDLMASGRFSYASFVRDLFDRELLAGGVHPDLEPDQRRAMDRALRRGSMRRRLSREVQRVLPAA